RARRPPVSRPRARCRARGDRRGGRAAPRPRAPPPPPAPGPPPPETRRAPGPDRRAWASPAARRARPPPAGPAPPPARPARAPRRRRRRAGAPPRDPGGLGVGGGVGRDRPRADGGGVVAHHVREREHVDRPARLEPEAPALHRRQMLPPRVELADGGPAPRHR